MTIRQFCQSDTFPSLSWLLNSDIFLQLSCPIVPTSDLPAHLLPCGTESLAVKMGAWAWPLVITTWRGGDEDRTRKRWRLEHLVEGGHPGTLIALEEETHRVRLVVTHDRRRIVWKVMGQPHRNTLHW